MSGATVLTARRLGTYCESVAIASGGLGCLVLCAWVFHIESLKSIVPGYVEMKANTAVGLMITAASLWLLLPTESSTFRRYSAYSLAAFASVMGAATLGEYVFGLQLGIDELLFVDYVGAALFPGRMAPATALGFLLLGVALMMLNWQAERAYGVAQGIALSVGAIAMLSVNGYIYHASAPSQHLLYQRVALHTAFGLLALSSGVFLARPQSGIVVDLVSESVGGITARRLLPAVVLVPLLLGWLRMRGQSVGLYGAEFGLALNATSYIVVFTMFVWINARKMNRELQRKDSVSLTCIS